MMKPEAHRQKIGRLSEGVSRLDPERDVDLLVEASLGIALHALAVLADAAHGAHLDTHAGLHRFLRERKMDEEARSFLELTELRAGAWYGNRATAAAARRAMVIAESLRSRTAGGRT